MGNIPAGGGGGTSSPLTTKGDVWGFSTTNARIPVGADTQVLAANSGQALGVGWAAASPLTTKGDIYIFSGGSNARLGAGSDNNVLTADSGSIDGLSWKTPNGQISPPYIDVSGSKYGPAFALTVPPALGSWTWVNQNGAAANTTNGFLNLISPLTSGDNFNLLVVAAPSTPYTKTAFLNFLYFSFAGLVFRESGSGKIVVYGFADNSGATTMAAIKYTSPTAFSAIYSQVNLHVFNTPGIWLRIADNGTSRISSYSLDGVNFFAFHTVARTDFLTADQVGIAINANNTSFASILNLMSWA